MAHETPIHGSHNIIIQRVEESTLTLNIGGEVQEIRNELSELKALLRNLKVQNVQHAEKIYNIEHIDEANFGFVTGKKAFNESLTLQLIEAISPASDAATRFLEKVKQIPDWESQDRICNKAKEIIAYSFVGVLGIQLSKLMAIGKEDFSEAKQRKYIEKCIYIVTCSLDLLGFVLLSQLWDEQKRKARTFDPAAQEALAQFFEGSFEASIGERFRFLQTLHRLFSAPQHQLAFPFEDWEALGTALQDNSPFHQSCVRLGEFHAQLDKAQYDLLTCFEAEKELTTFLRRLHFLANYRMVSIRHIGYRQPRNTDPHYLHRYTALGIDSKANVDAEKVNFTPDTEQTDAVLLYRGDKYRENISLSPFVIDYNALTFEHGAKVCFYRSRAIDGDLLEYVFLEDQGVVRLEKQDILGAHSDMNELMMQPEKQQILNLDQVVDQFAHAHQCLLPDALNFEDL